MVRVGAATVRWLGAVALVLGTWASAAPCAAQETADAVARDLFLRGRDAYRADDYEAALTAFQDAYRLSPRGALQYNIGLAASRLDRHQEALFAFERYLKETADPPRRDEVQTRIATLREILARREAEAQLSVQSVASDPLERKVPQSAIIGGSVLAAVGTAGVVAMGVGLARRGECLDTNADGECLTRRVSSPWTAVYGALGIAALAGSATWFAVSSRRAKKRRETAWTLTPTGVVVSGSF